MGYVCASVNPNGSLLQVTATALDSYSLLRTKLWTSTNSVESVPKKVDGGIKPLGCSYYICDFQGRFRMRWEVPIADRFGSDLSNILLQWLCIQKTAPLDKDGSVMNENKVHAFAAEFQVESPVWYGMVS